MKSFCFLATFMFSTFFSFTAVNATIITDDEDGMLCCKYPGPSKVSSKGYLRLFYVDPDRYAHTIHTKVKCSGCHTDINKIPHETAERVRVTVRNKSQKIAPDS